MKNLSNVKRIGIASLCIVLLTSCFDDPVKVNQADIALQAEISKLANRYWSVPDGTGPSIYQQYSKGASGNYDLLKQYCSISNTSNNQNAQQQITELRTLMGVGLAGKETPQQLVFWEAIQEVASTQVCSK